MWWSMKKDDLEFIYSRTVEISWIPWFSEIWGTQKLSEFQKKYLKYIVS